MKFTSEHLLFLIFLFTMANCLLNLAVLYILSKNKITQSQEELAKIMMRFLIIIGIISLMGICSAQDEEELATLPDGDKPVVFPEPMQKAASGITGWLDEMAVQSGHAAFLHDNWTLNLSNMTGLFTA